MARAKKKNPIAVAMAKLRSKSLSAERRSEIAAKAAEARWGKPKKRAQIKKPG